MWRYALLLGGVWLLVVEPAAWFAGTRLAHVGLIFTAREYEEFDRYLEQRDPLLGWPAPDSFGSGEYDASGSRVVPAFPDPAVPSCVALFGDSFSWGDDVSAEHAYGNVLAERLGCRVANYGVGGYGTDQALLRYLDRIRDPAPVVILGHYAENVIRNVNRLRDLLGGGGPGLKPRFLLRDGELKLLPLPDLSRDQLEGLHRDPSPLTDEFFLPGGPAGVVSLRFPFVWSVLHATRHYRVRAFFRPGPSYGEFYRPDHASGALELTAEIVERFVRTATERGQLPIVVLIPDQQNLAELRSNGRVSYAPLKDALQERGIEVPPVAERLVQGLAGGDPCSLYTHCGNAHFNPDGYAKFATIVADWLESRGVDPRQLLADPGTPLARR